MAIDLWLLRHGEAEPHGTRPDADRELTARGRAQSVAAGEALAALGIEFDAIFASPKVRAWDTAMLASDALGIEPIEESTLAYGPDVSEARALVRAGGGRVLLVGHDPFFSQLIYDMTGARAPLSKAAVAGISTASPGELAVLLRPKHLAAIASRDA